MKIKNCECGGDVYVFKERRAPINYTSGREAYWKSREEHDRQRFFWAECSRCGQSSALRATHHEAVDSFLVIKGGE